MKVLLLALHSMDVLAKMCAIFTMLLAMALREKAPATTAFLDQCNDFRNNVVYVMTFFHCQSSLLR